MRAVEGFGNGLFPAVAEIRRHRDAQFVALTLVAAVGMEGDGHRFVGKAVSGQFPPRPGSHHAVFLRDGSQIGLREVRPVARHEVVADIGAEQAGGGADAGVRRDDRFGDAEFAGDLGGKGGAGAAECDQHEIARIVALGNAAQPDRIDHMPAGYPVDAQRRSLERNAERFGDRAADRLLGQRRIDGDTRAFESLRPKPAEADQRIGHRRFRAAQAVTGRPRHGACAARPDLEHTGFVDDGDGAAARADTVDIDHRHHGVVIADPRVEHMFQMQRPIARNADIGRCAADIEGDDAGMADRPADIDTLDQRADRPGGEERDRSLHRDAGADQAARRRHQAKIGADAEAAQRFAEAGRVGRRRRPDIGIQRRG